MSKLALNVDNLKGPTDFLALVENANLYVDEVKAIIIEHLTPPKSLYSY